MNDCCVSNDGLGREEREERRDRDLALEAGEELGHVPHSVFRQPGRKLRKRFRFC
jgi:hypothetical protein